MKTKYCKKCDQDKDKTEFHKRTNAKDGLALYCKKCYKKAYPNNKKHVTQDQEEMLRVHAFKSFFWWQMAETKDPLQAFMLALNCTRDDKMVGTPEQLKEYVGMQYQGKKFSYAGQKRILNDDCQHKHGLKVRWGRREVSE